jgi:hypothetical protein
MSLARENRNGNKGLTLVTCEESDSLFDCGQCCDSQFHGHIFDVRVSGEGPQKELDV